MPDETERTLALFDFDGTITHKDTLLEIMKFICGNRRFYFGMMILSPYLFLYFIKIISNWKAKERLLSYFFSGMPYQDFHGNCERFTKELLPTLLRKNALDEVLDLKKRGVRVVVVTASAEGWVKPWCDQLGIECIATRLEIKGGQLTGKIKGKNCNGKEKVNRIKALIDLSQYDDILAFGDSKNDIPMLELATDPYYRAFH